MIPWQHNGSTELRVLIADDHAMILELFSLYVGARSGHAVTVARDLNEAAALIEEQGPYDVTLLDWNMGGMHGVGGLKKILDMAGGRPVGILTGEITPKGITEALSAGASGIVLKSQGARSLLNAIQMMATGERYVPFDLMMNRKTVRAKDTTLTDKEMQVLAELADGRRNKEICAELQLALPTVKMHVLSICRKLNAKNRLHATVVARDLGLL